MNVLNDGNVLIVVVEVVVVVVGCGSECNTKLLTLLFITLIIGL